MGNLPLAIEHPIFLTCGIILGVICLVVIIMSIPDIVRYIKITWM